MARVVSRARRQRDDASVTYGKTRAEVLCKARDLLTLLVADYVEDGRELPDPGELVECVPVNVEVTAETIEESHYVTQARAAEELGVSRFRIGALLASGKLEGREFGGRRKVSLESVARYAAERRGAGRPPKVA